MLAWIALALAVVSCVLSFYVVVQSYRIVKITQANALAARARYEAMLRRR